MIWQTRTRRFDIGSRPLIMGIVNVTPDSFSDGGLYFNAMNAIEHGLQLVSEGADILDIGGESSRPGSKPVTLEEEMSRVLPVVEGLVKATQVPISIDTTKAAIADVCLRAGASIINDITAMGGDSNMADVVRSYNAGVCLMHMQGTPETMQINPTYGDVVADVKTFFQERIAFAINAGIPLENITIDPGIGFGKSVEHNYELLRRISEFNEIAHPLLLGVSRKGFIGIATGKPRQERAIGSIAIACHCTSQGSAHIWRVHDVAQSVDAAKMLGAML